MRFDQALNILHSLGLRLTLGLCMLLSTSTLNAWQNKELDEKLDALSLNESAYELFKEGKYQKAFFTALKAKSAAERINDKKQLARSLSNIASTSMYLGNFEEAMKLYQSSLELSREIDDLEGIESALNNISGVYLRLENPQESLAYLLKLPVLNGIDRPDYQKAVAYIGLVSRYRTLALESEAEAYLKKLSQLFEHYDNSFLKIYYNFIKVDESIDKDDYKTAESTLEETRSLAEKENFSGLQVITLRRVADLKMKQGDIVGSREVALLALKLASELQHNTQLLALYKFLYELDKQEGAFESALEKKEKIDLLSKSIEGEKVMLQAEITKVERKTRETEEQLKLSLQQQKIAELKLATQKQLQIIWGAVFVVSGALIMFWFYRRATRLEILRQKRLNEELKRLDKVKDRILTNTSHELRTPLNGIIGLSQVLLIENEDKLEQESLDHLKLIEKSGNQLSEIVDDILDLAKLRTHYVNFKPSEFSISPLINEVILTCRPLLKNKAVEMSIDERSEDCQLLQDRTRLKQVLFNLIGNAAKFTPEGSISVKAKSISDKLEIVVKDTGIGIPENMQDRVFEGFEQVDASDSRENGGSGLGLAICKEIVEGLGGKIKLESQLGKGTCVSVTIPTKLTRSSQ